MRLSKSLFLFVLLCLSSVISLKAQGYRAKLNSDNVVTCRASKLYFGFTGGVNCTALRYPMLNDQKQRPRFSYDVGAFLEWRFFDKCSLGLNAAYTNRKAGLSFDTPYLVSFDQTAVTNITYRLSVSGVEMDMPITWYFGKPKTWMESYYRPFVFMGPAFFLALGGSMEWSRTHLIDNQQLASYEMSLSDHSMFPYDYGAVAGVGLIYKQKVRRYYFVTKAALSFYYGLSDTFSEAEKKHAVQFYGLGDIQHEILGTRHFCYLKLSLSFAMPFRDKPAAACRDFGIY